LLFTCLSTTLEKKEKHEKREKRRKRQRREWKKYRDIEKRKEKNDCSFKCTASHMAATFYISIWPVEIWTPRSGSGVALNIQTISFCWKDRIKPTLNTPLFTRESR